MYIIILLASALLVIHYNHIRISVPVVSDISANSSPVITVSSTLNATIGQKVTLHVTTSDKDGDDVTLSLQSELPAGASFDATSGTFKWTPRSLERVNIS